MSGKPQVPTIMATVHRPKPRAPVVQAFGAPMLVPATSVVFAHPIAPKPRKGVSDPDYAPEDEEMVGVEEQDTGAEPMVVEPIKAARKRKSVSWRSQRGKRTRAIVLSSVASDELGRGKIVSNAVGRLPLDNQVVCVHPYTPETVAYFADPVKNPNCVVFSEDNVCAVMNGATITIVDRASLGAGVSTSHPSISTSTLAAPLRKSDRKGVLRNVIRDRIGLVQLDPLAPAPTPASAHIAESDWVSCSWSPSGSQDDASCLLAGLTSDSQLAIFMAKAVPFTGLSDWQMCVNVGELLATAYRRHQWSSPLLPFIEFCWPINVREKPVTDESEAYARSALISVTSMCWLPFHYKHHGRCFNLLAVGTLAGVVSLWGIVAPFAERNGKPDVLLLSTWVIAAPTSDDAKAPSASSSSSSSSSTTLVSPGAEAITSMHWTDVAEEADKAGSLYTLLAVGVPSGHVKLLSVGLHRREVDKSGPRGRGMMSPRWPSSLPTGSGAMSSPSFAGRQSSLPALSATVQVACVLEPHSPALNFGRSMLLTSRILAAQSSKHTRRVILACASGRSLMVADIRVGPPNSSASSSAGHLVTVRAVPVPVSAHGRTAADSKGRTAGFVDCQPLSAAPLHVRLVETDRAVHASNVAALDWLWEPQVSGNSSSSSVDSDLSEFCLFSVGADGHLRYWQPEYLEERPLPPVLRSVANAADTVSAVDSHDVLPREQVSPGQVLCGVSVSPDGTAIAAHLPDVENPGKLLLFPARTHPEVWTSAVKHTTRLPPIPRLPACSSNNCMSDCGPAATAPTVSIFASNIAACVRHVNGDGSMLVGDNAQWSARLHVAHQLLTWANGHKPSVVHPNASPSSSASSSSDADAPLLLSHSTELVVLSAVYSVVAVLLTPMVASQLEASAEELDPSKSDFIFSFAGAASKAAESYLVRCDTFKSQALVGWQRCDALLEMLHMYRTLREYARMAGNVDEENKASANDSSMCFARDTPSAVLASMGSAGISRMIRRMRTTLLPPKVLPASSVAAGKGAPPSASASSSSSSSSSNARRAAALYEASPAAQLPNVLCEQLVGFLDSLPAPPPSPDDAVAKSCPSCGVEVKDKDMPQTCLNGHELEWCRRTYTCLQLEDERVQCSVCEFSFLNDSMHSAFCLVCGGRLVRCGIRAGLRRVTGST